ncbi:hypothetical protein ACS0TY_030485 [Phlomoides rotata]
MGNVALMCAPSIISSSEVKVVSSDGRLLVYTRSVKAAEVMLENPGQFLCESTYLKVGQRIPGICAEEELERGQVYFLLPMEMLYSVLTNEELKFLSHKTSKGTLNFSKIFPEFCLFPSAAASEDNNADQHFEAIANINSSRYSRQRSWQPALETILETPSHN